MAWSRAGKQQSSVVLKHIALMVKKVEKIHRKGTREMGTGKHEMSGGSVMERHLFKFTPPVFRGGCIGLLNGYALGDSQRQGLLLSWRGSWVLS